MHARTSVCLLIATAVCSAAVGCSSKPHGGSGVAAKPHADPGYAPERRYQATAIQDTWLVQSERVDIRLLVPTQAGSYPLVFYFPGLGEAADAGLAWRQAWAQAGYAVLSAQPVKYGAAVWSSDRAHAGDFSTSPETLSRRPLWRHVPSSHAGSSTRLGAATKSRTTRR